MRFFDLIDTQEVLCLAALKGSTLEYYIGKISDEEIVAHYARSLKLLHSVPLDSNAQLQPLDLKISKAKLQMDNGLVDIKDLQPENQGLTPSKLFDRLLQLKPLNDELVFTHGDYSLII